MPEADIKIVRYGDEPPWGDLSTKSIDHRTDPWSISILEGGMTSGQPSVAIRFDLGDGHVLISETSLAILASITVAARAAFPDAFAGGPLEVRT